MKPGESVDPTGGFLLVFPTLGLKDVCLKGLGCLDAGVFC